MPKTFEQLSESGKQRALEEHRNWNVDDSFWYECVYSNFRHSMKELGWTVEGMEFSGFWSQGDGARWRGYIEPAKVADWVRQHHPHLPMSLAITAGISGDDWGEIYFRIQWSQSHYTHDGTMVAVIDGVDINEARSSISWATACEEIENNALEFAREHARRLYKALEAEYDYLTSDEAVIDALEANEMEFDYDDDEEDQAEAEAA